MKTIQGSWPLNDWRLNPADIHVWAISLDVSPADLSTCKKILSPPEIERARSFRFEQHQNRFIAGRGLMRMLLGRYLHVEPADLEFVYGPHGKPFLSGAFADSRLNFNLAHSENLALLAVTRAGMIGVDIERIRPMDDAGQLVGRFFSARESSTFQKLPREQKNIAFFNLWTRKEAWLKAIGEGIEHLLKRVEVSFLPGEPAQFINLPGNAQITEPWVIHNLDPAPGFAAALAVRAPVTSLHCCCWGEEATRKIMEP